MLDDISITDFLAITNIQHEWIMRYDTKDWDRLAAILAPHVTLDMTSVGGEVHGELSTQDYVRMLSSDRWIGSKRLKTQHLIGAVHWTQLEDGTIECPIQLSVSHQLFDEDVSQVVKKGRAVGFNTHRYKKFDGRWKLVLVKAQMLFTEDQFLETIMA